MSKKNIARIARQPQSHRAIGASEVHSVAEQAPIVDARWARSRAAYDAAIAAGADSSEAYAAAQAVYEAE